MGAFVDLEQGQVKPVVAPQDPRGRLRSIVEPMPSTRRTDPGLSTASLTTWALVM